MNAPTEKPLPPGRFGLPLLGETLSFAKDAFAFVDERLARHGPVFRTSLLGRKAAFLAGPAGAAAFIDPENCKRSGSLPGNILALFGGVAVNSLDGEAHVNRKRAIMAAFTQEALASYVPGLESVVAGQLEAWADAGEQPLLPGMKRMSVGSVAKAIYGIDPGPEVDAITLDVERVNDALTAVPLNLPFTTYGKGARAVARNVARLEGLIAAHRKDARDDGVSLMLAFSEPKLADQEAARELHHLGVAAYIVFAEIVGLVIQLSKHPEVRDKLRAEVEEKAASGALTREQLEGMPWLQQVCLEVKRFTPVVPFMLGLAKRTFEVGGYRIPEGWMLGHVLYASMHSHGVFSEPERFDPDRFSPERAEHERDANSMVAQGAGEYHGRGHLCAGVEFSTLLMNVFAVHLVRDYELELPSQDLSLNMGAVPPSPRSGLVARLRRRR